MLVDAGGEARRHRVSQHREAGERDHFPEFWNTTLCSFCRVFVIQGHILGIDGGSSRRQAAPRCWQSLYQDPSLREIGVTLKGFPST